MFVQVTVCFNAKLCEVWTLVCKQWMFTYFDWLQLNHSIRPQSRFSIMSIVTTIDHEIVLFCCIFENVLFSNANFHELKDQKIWSFIHSFIFFILLIHHNRRPRLRIWLQQLWLWLQQRLLENAPIFPIHKLRHQKNKNNQQPDLF